MNFIDSKIISTEIKFCTILIKINCLQSRNAIVLDKKEMDKAENHFHTFEYQFCKTQF